MFRLMTKIHCGIQPRYFSLKAHQMRWGLHARHCHTEEFQIADVRSSETDYKVYYEDHYPKKASSTVVCIHGDPGASDNFKELVKPLHDQGIRVIIPNFPGYGTTHSIQRGEGTSDWLSRDHRSQLLSDFIDAIRLHSIDVLVTHSAGSWTGVSIAASNHLVKSICFLNPVGHRPHRTLRPFGFLKSFVGLLKTPCRVLARPLLVAAYRLLGFSMSSPRDLVTSGSVAFSVDFDKVNEDIKKLKSRNLPSLIAHTRNDKIVESDIPYEFGPMIGIPRDHYLRYCKEGKAEESQDKDYLVDGVFKKALSMARGGHYVHRSFPEEIAKHISLLILNTKSLKS